MCERFKRALGSDRIAAAWYTSYFLDIDINLTDGQTHQLAMYCVDWDTNNTRSQGIVVWNAAIGVILDNRNLTAFSNGQYLIWNVSGHVKLRVTTTVDPMRL